MKIVLTGSLGHISQPLAIDLIAKGHSVTVISSKTEREKEIAALGAKAAVGSIDDAGFLTKTFKGADIVYTMIALNTHSGAYFDKNFDLEAGHKRIAEIYAQAIQDAGVTKVIHLSTIGAHMPTGVGMLNPHFHVEATLNKLPQTIHIKFMRPVGFYYNMFGYIPAIKNTSSIVQNYGGNENEPWVSHLDIAATIVEEMEKPFEGRAVRYIASDEAAPNEVATTLGNAIGIPDLKITVIADEEFKANLIKIGMTPQVAKGLTEMNASRVNGVLYQDYYKHKPILGKVKLADFAKEFAAVYHHNNSN
ncbi:NmrA family NAD(P)-binding protein [Sphingobacterium bambusae]|uniref:NAD(P)H-binding protein n=1 Tax=Sphingobacterium bambusae TaxID=662858 RepID=A0ABW6BHJ8_9SPHI|nr:NAD(P)H-binding protein [Sphingobacterium bambusae]WPL49450.1 NAD(P)H-binding protein [Sphingobacterium bambusae]